LNARVTATAYRGGSRTYAPSNLTDENAETYWATDDGIISTAFEIELAEPAVVNYVVLQEYIKLGQRVKSFEIELWKDSAWQKVAEATTIGYKRILKIDPTETSKLRINIRDSKACPVISTVELF
jgi:alpha-L-fucosidase